MLWLYILTRVHGRWRGTWWKANSPGKTTTSSWPLLELWWAESSCRSVGPKVSIPNSVPINKRLHKPLKLFVFAELQLWRGGCQEDFQEAVTWILKFKFYFLYKSHSPVNCIWSYCWHLAYFTRRIMVTMFMKHWNGHTAQLNLHPFSYERRKQTLNSILAVDIYL